MIRKTLLIAALAAASLAGVAGRACAQNTATLSTPSSATVFQPITLTQTSELSFGTVVRPSPGGGSGTLAIAASDGTRTLTGAGAMLNTGPNLSARRATYTVGGEGGQTYSVTVPTTFNMTRTGGAETLTVTLTSTAASGTLSNALGSAGTNTFGVGGSIVITETTASGAYTGSFNVTVAYN